MKQEPATAARHVAPPDRKVESESPGFSRGEEVKLVFGTTTPGSGAALGQILAEGFFATGVILTLLVFFRRFVAGQGRLWRFLSANAYAVYVLHALVLVGLGVALSGWEGAAVAKFAVLAALAVPLTWVLAAIVRALPGAERVL